MRTQRIVQAPARLLMGPGAVRKSRARAHLRTGARKSAAQAPRSTCRDGNVVSGEELATLSKVAGLRVKRYERSRMRAWRVVEVCWEGAASEDIKAGIARWIGRELAEGAQLGMKLAFFEWQPQRKMRLEREEAEGGWYEPALLATDSARLRKLGVEEGWGGYPLCRREVGSKGGEVVPKCDSQCTFALGLGTFRRK